MLELKSEYKNFIEQNKAEIAKLESVFFENGHALLRGKKLPLKTKQAINKFWDASPISKIQNGFVTHALLDAELKDLKTDSFCKKNTNKVYWLKSYILGWLSNLPNTASDEYLIHALSTREANRIMLQNAYETK